MSATNKSRAKLKLHLYLTDGRNLKRVWNGYPSINAGSSYGTTVGGLYSNLYFMTLEYESGGNVGNHSFMGCVGGNSPEVYEAPLVFRRCQTKLIGCVALIARRPILVGSLGRCE